ncbi:B12-binding domain-containing protein [Chloroflexota bacterium]
MSEKLVDAIANMREEETLNLAKEMLDSGQEPMQILELCRKGVDIVGKRFEKGEYFLPELILAGEMLNQISEMVKPKLTGAVRTERLGKVVIGTVKGDIHDIGKNIVTFVLDVNDFEVYDLGVDVPTQEFVRAIKETQPQVVALSGFLTLTYDAMKQTIEAIRDAGLRDRVKIMIGGGQINDKIREYAGADAYGRDAMAGVALVKKWLGGG